MVHWFFFLSFCLFLTRRLKGKELDGMSFPDLISLENQLNDSLHSVKDQKVKNKVLIYSKNLRDHVRFFADLKTFVLI